MISVCFMCFDRQETLDITLPLWLKQEGVEYELCLALGPTIKVPEKWDMPQIRTLRIPDTRFSKWYNALADIAKGDKLLLTQCDFQVNSPTQLKRMLDNWEPGVMVSEKVFVYGKRTPGIFLHCLLLEKAVYDEVGGLCPLFDNPLSVAYEDSDFIATMLERGMQFRWTETPEDEGVYHIDHPRPNYSKDANGQWLDPVIGKRLEYGKALYDSRHSKTVLELYTRQFALGMMAKRK